MTALTAVSTSAAVVASLAIGGGTATAAAANPYTVSSQCVAGDARPKSPNVDCTSAVPPVVGTVVGGVLNQVVTQVPVLGPLAKLLGVDFTKLVTSSASVTLGNGTATIAGNGLSVAVEGASGILVPDGGDVGAYGLTPLSATVAVGIGGGSAHATAIDGVALSFSSGAGARADATARGGGAVAVALGNGAKADAFALGGTASAVTSAGLLGVPQGAGVSCTAVLAHASVAGVGSCTSVLFLLQVTSEIKGEKTSFYVALANPLSLKALTLPQILPYFSTDLIRFGIGPEGPTIDGDLVNVLNGLTKKASSARAVAPAVGSVALPTTLRTAETASAVKALADVTQTQPTIHDDETSAPVTEIRDSEAPATGTATTTAPTTVTPPAVTPATQTPMIGTSAPTTPGSSAGTPSAGASAVESPESASAATTPKADASSGAAVGRDATAVTGRHHKAHDDTSSGFVINR